ncbi:TPM domain-containing protein [Sphingomonas sp. GCM10030256]|uniref:TPM domain-containing protein n=1 Tax=Sphingomonas sp. GCM10030256 TaxID=3273427 RepID=UPI003610AB91
MVSVRITEADHQRVSGAIAAAEAKSDGEIVTMVTELSDSYHDVALHWAVAVLIAVLAWTAAFPMALQWGYSQLFGGWGVEPGLGALLFFLMVLAVLKFTVVLLVLRYMQLRLTLTPAATKQRRVRRRAISMFKAAAERRTVGRTGILIYLSLGEHRAEIVADEAIHDVTTPETWGEAMAALVAEVKEGRPADGMIAAIGLVGEVLAEHFPRSSTDTNEIPDKLIEL